MDFSFLFTVYLYVQNWLVTNISLFDIALVFFVMFTLGLIFLRGYSKVLFIIFVALMVIICLWLSFPDINNGVSCIIAGFSGISTSIWLNHYFSSPSKSKVDDVIFNSEGV